MADNFSVVSRSQDYDHLSRAHSDATVCGIELSKMHLMARGIFTLASAKETAGSVKGLCPDCEKIAKGDNAEARNPERAACRWTPDEDGVYDTECGGRWFFDSGTPAENKAAFCMYCGNALHDTGTQTAGQASGDPK